MNKVALEVTYRIYQKGSNGISTSQIGTLDICESNTSLVIPTPEGVCKRIESFKDEIIHDYLDALII